MGFLPSKNFIAIIGSAIVVIFAGYFASFVWKIGHVEKVAITNTIKNDAAMADAVKDANLDSDNDGLKNWEELLWKTDINKADTDGDGMADGEEITNGRDPIIKRVLLAGGSWSDVFKKPEEVVAGDGKSGTLTEKLAHDFVSSYFATKSAAGGQSLNTATKSAITNSLALSVEQGVASYSDIYKKSDIKVSASAEPKNYLNGVGAILADNFKNIDGMEVELTSVIGQTGKFEELSRLDPYLEAYKKTVAFLANEPVPPAYAEFHLSMLNSMNNTGLAVENLKLLEHDPIRSLIGVQLYYREISRARQYLAELKSLTEKDKITFSDADKGSFFNQYFKKL